MGELWRMRDGSKGRVLRREVLVPMASARRPVTVLVATMAVILLAATVDAMLWQHTRQQANLRAEVQALETEILRVQRELFLMRADTEELQHDLSKSLIEAERLVREPDWVHEERRIPSCGLRLQPPAATEAPAAPVRISEACLLDPLGC